MCKKKQVSDLCFQADRAAADQKRPQQTQHPAEENYQVLGEGMQHLHAFSVTTWHCANVSEHGCDSCADCCPRLRTGTTTAWTPVWRVARAGARGGAGGGAAQRATIMR